MGSEFTASPLAGALQMQVRRTGGLRFKPIYPLDPLNSLFTGGFNGLGTMFPAACAALIQAIIASSSSDSASGSVSPNAEQPGKSGAMAMKPSSSSSQNI